MNNLTRFVLLAALAPAAYSQSVLYNFNSDSMADEFGHSVSGAGDVNGDGYADLIAGARYGINNGVRSGTAHVFSGVDGSTLYTFYGDSKDDEFGHSVSGAGDVNGDGYADLIVGARYDDNTGPYSGSARVFSGLDGSILYTLNGDSAGEAFGGSVNGAGDVNGDGFDDLIVGADHNDNKGYATGSARVFSGFDGSVLYTFYGDSTYDYFGYAVNGAGDVDGDGYGDLIVGAPGDDNNGYGSGSARVFSGLDGSILYTIDGDSAWDIFGMSVSGAQDVNGDGFSDLIVGAPYDDNNGEQSGSARVFSGVDGSTLYTLNGDSRKDEFGRSVSGAGDVNGDGYADLIVGARHDDNNGPNSGSARVFSGVDGSILYTLNGDSASSRFGVSVSGAGDVNGDGNADLIVGTNYIGNNGIWSGRARVFSGCDFCSPIGQNYCGPANFNSTGQSAMLSAFGGTTASFNLVSLTASQLPLNVFGYFLNSDVQDFNPLPPGSNGTLCLGGGIGRHVKQVGNSGPAGELVIDVDLTALQRPKGTYSVLAGETWNFQCWFQDNVGGPTSNFTDGVSIVFN